MFEFAKKTWIITKKELFTSLMSPAVYIGVLVFVLGSTANFFFANQFFVPGKGSSDLRLFYSFFPYISILCIPSFTMHLWTNEISDVVFSLPVPALALVLGKWISSLIFCIFIQLVLLLVPIAVQTAGSVDIGQVTAANIVILLYFAASTALGELLSLSTKNQVTSAILTALVLSLLNSAHLLPVLFRLPQFLEKFFKGISFAYHFDAASKGIIAFRDLLFYLALTAFFIGAHIAIIESQKENA